MAKVDSILSSNIQFSFFEFNNKARKVFYKILSYLDENSIKSLCLTSKKFYSWIKLSSLKNVQEIFCNSLSMLIFNQSYRNDLNQFLMKKSIPISLKNDEIIEWLNDSSINNRKDFDNLMKFSICKKLFKETFVLENLLIEKEISTLKKILLDKSIYKASEQIDELLISTIYVNSFEILTLLLNHFEFSNAIYTKAVEKACFFTKIEEVKLLLCQKAFKECFKPKKIFKNIIDVDSEHNASRVKKNHILKLLLNDGRFNPAVNFNQPLRRAVKSLNIFAIELLLKDHRVDKSFMNHRKLIPLIQNRKIVKSFFIDANGNINL